MDGPADIMWAGEDPVEWDMEVENTGRAEATVVFAASERDDPDVQAWTTSRFRSSPHR